MAILNSHFQYIILLNLILDYKLLILSVVVNAFYLIFYYLAVLLPLPFLSASTPLTGSVNHIRLLISEAMSSFSHMPLPARILSFLLLLLRSSPINIQSFQDSLSLPTLTQRLLGSIQLKVIFSLLCPFPTPSLHHSQSTFVASFTTRSVRIWICVSSPLLSSLPTLDSTFLKVRVNFSYL